LRGAVSAIANRLGNCKSIQCAQEALTAVIQLLKQVVKDRGPAWPTKAQ